MSKLYKGISGTRYKYDLDNPIDKQAYELDLLAQLNDAINPNIELDRAMGKNFAGTMLNNNIPTLNKDKNEKASYSAYACSKC